MDVTGVMPLLACPHDTAEEGNTMTTTLQLTPGEARQRTTSMSTVAARAPKVSIIIPAYDEEAAIQRCLAAAVDQEIPAWEIIVVDNRSTDRTTDIVRRVAAEHPQARIRLLHQSAAQGLVPTRNLGFASATGDVLGRIDADTIVDRTWVARIAEEMRDPAVGAVTGPVTYYDLPMIGATRLSDDLVRRALRRLGSEYPFLYGSNMAIRADAWRAIQHVACLDPDDLFHEDIDLSIHLHEAGIGVSYLSSMRAAVSARRLSSSSASFRDYTSRFERTYAHHHVHHWHLRAPELLLEGLYWPARMMRVLSDAPAPMTPAPVTP